VTRHFPDNLVLFARLDEAAEKAGRRLTHTQKLFFLRLLTVAQKDDEGYFIKDTHKGFAEAFEMPERTVTECLSKLTACGILINSNGRKSISRRMNDAIIAKE